MADRITDDAATKQFRGDARAPNEPARCRAAIHGLSGQRCRQDHPDPHRRQSASPNGDTVHVADHRTLRAQ